MSDLIELPPGTLLPTEADIKVTDRGSQRDVVHLGWPIAPSYMSPNAGDGGRLRGLSQRVQLCTLSPNKLWRYTVTPYLTYGVTAFYKFLWDWAFWHDDKGMILYFFILVSAFSERNKNNGATDECSLMYKKLIPFIFKSFLTVVRYS